MFNKVKNTVCCSKMEGLYKAQSSYGINFRVIKNSTRFIEESKKREVFIDSNEYRYVLTDGYSGKLSSEETKILFIEYCPFCGKKLEKVFKSDTQINETNHDW